VRTVRVLIVDDQARFRRAAAAVVESLDGFAFVGAALDGKSRPGAVATVLLTGARGAVRRHVLLDIVSCTAAPARLSLLPG
jgi:response regulator of citrate/malate metabolism